MEKKTTGRKINLPHTFHVYIFAISSNGVLLLQNAYTAQDLHGVDASTSLHSTSEGSHDLPLCYPERVIQPFPIDDPADIEELPHLKTREL